MIAVGRWTRRALLCSLWASGCGSETATEPTEGTWHGGVGQLMIEKCGTCHQEGEIGSSTFVLDYEQSSAWSSAIADAVVSRRMPPMGANNDGSCNTYSNARWLEQDEIDTIVDWVDAGTPKGAAVEMPAPPKLNPLPRVDGVFRTPSYQVTGVRADEYRCYIIDSPITEDRYLTGFNIKPGNTEVTHHLNFFMLSEEDIASAEELDAADPGPGFSCYGGPPTNFSLRELSGEITLPLVQDLLERAPQPRMAWAPGSSAIRFPAGTGLPMPANRKFFVEVHYSATTGPAMDPGIDIEFMTEKEVDETGVVLPLIDVDLELPPGQENVVSTGFEITLPMQVKVYAYAPHMHKLGRTVLVEHADEEGNRTCIAKTDNYDYNWQDAWYFDEPMKFAPGGTYSIECGYDTRSRNETVRWGGGVEDEMCIGFFYLTSPILLGL